MKHKIMVVVIFVYILLLVFLSTFGYMDKKNINELNNLENKIVTVIGEVKNIPREVYRGKKSFVIESYYVEAKKINKKIKVTIITKCPIYYGSIIKIKGKLKYIDKVDFLKYLRNKNIVYLMNVKNLKDYEIIRKPQYFKLFIHEIRNSILNKFEKILHGHAHRFTLALVLGQKEKFYNYELESIKNAGLSHIVAVSGMHVNFILGLFMLLKIDDNKYLYILIIVFAWIYTFIVGFPISCVRAATMLSLMQVAKIFNMDYHPLYSLLLAAFIILLIFPKSISLIGFQFSFLASFGILYLSNDLKGFFRFLPVIFQNSACVSFSAQIVLLPLFINYFGEIKVFSIISNVLMAPVVFIVFVLSFFSLFLSYISITIASLVGEVIWVLTGIILTFSYYISKLEFNNIVCKNISFLWVISYYLCFLIFPKIKCIKTINKCS